jgi:ribosomal protein S12 methylthiotransferase accessory factor
LRTKIDVIIASDAPVSYSGEGVQPMEEPAEEARNLFWRLGARLAAGGAAQGGAGDEQSILESLEYLPIDESKPDEANHRIALLKAASRFSRVFQLAAPDAPGLTFFGAEVSPGIVDPAYMHRPRSSASGVGLSLRQAFEGCIGEGVEHLSQFETEQDQFHGATMEDGLSAFDSTSRTMLSALLRSSADGASNSIEWIEAVQLSNGRPILFPADLCFRRHPERSTFAPPFPLSLGCAAGPTFEAAAVHGMLELIERDAVGLWWRGGVRGRLIALEGEAVSVATGLVAQVRRRTNTRRTWLLDITTDLGVPSVVAVSCRLDGRGFACGFAARLTMQNAVRSALMEMCQTELAYVVVEAKRREGGDAALNEYDHRHLARSTSDDTADCELLRPVVPTRSIDEIAAATPAQQLAALVQRLSVNGIETFAVDFTRPAFGIPVVRIAAPALQMEPCEVATGRLASVRNRTGGGERYTRGISLL